MFVESAPQRRAWVTAIAVICIDQLSKQFAQWALSPVFNSGFSFAIGQRWPVATFYILGVVALCMISSLRPVRTIWQQRPIFAGLFFGGAISNLFDRLLYGSVVDWLRLPMLGITNNIADWGIAIGAAGILVAIWHEKTPVEKRGG